MDPIEFWNRRIVSPARVVGPGEPIPILEILIIEIENDHRINASDAEGTRELDLNHRLGIMLPEQHQRA